MSLLDLLLPLYCARCGRAGSALCAECTVTTLKELENCCVACGNYAAGWRCPDCGLDDTFAFGFYDQLIGELAAELKFKSARHLARPLAKLLAKAMPEVAGRVTVMAVPTIKKHKRERGVAHAELVASKLAKIKGWEYAQMLARKDESVQLGQSKKKRKEQAKKAYEVAGEADELAGFDAVVLYDDITTTGATLDECAKLLRAAGAKKVFRVVLAKTR